MAMYDSSDERINDKPDYKPYYPATKSRQMSYLANKTMMLRLKRREADQRENKSSIEDDDTMNDLSTQHHHKRTTPTGRV